MAETSDMRRVLMASICNATYRGSSEQKRELAEHLEVLPFESMTDDALVEMAFGIIGEAEVERITLSVSAERYETQTKYFLCPDCLDQRVVPADEPGWWKRCERCNPNGVAPEVGQPVFRRRRREPVKS